MSPGADDPYCLPFEECDGDMVDLVGGKNASLGALVDAGAPVPPGFAVTTAFYRAFLDEHGIGPEVAAATADLAETDEAAVRDAAEGIQSSIRNAAIPEDLGDAIRTAWDRLDERVTGENLSVAVRSSATAEDTEEASFAGQHETYLHVDGPEAVLDRVRDCMGSLFTPRAITYRAEQDVAHEEVFISVGVQRMVDAEVSGVLFTLNPANGDRSKVRIEAHWGLGEAVVSGSVTPDSYLVDKPTGTVVDRTVAEKTEMITAGSEGVQSRPVPAEKRATSCLDGDEIEALTEIGKDLERAFGAPQDVEWVLGEDAPFPENLYVVQSRPETTWS